MKKPVKVAKKAVATKKVVATKSSTKTVAKAKKVVAKAAPAKKAVAKKAITVAKKVVAKKTVTKPVLKATPNKKPIVKSNKDKKSSQAKLEKTIQAKIKNTHLKKGKVEAKIPAKIELKKPAKIEVEKSKVKNQPAEKISIKPEIQTQSIVKKNTKAEVNVSKKDLKPEVKKASGKSKKSEKNLKNREEEEDLLLTPDSELEGEESSRKNEEEDDLDDLAPATPVKVKMTFDEDLEVDIIPTRKKSKSVLDDDIKDHLVEEVLALADDYTFEDVISSIRDLNLFKIESDECIVRGCDNPSTTIGHCRFHYIKLWKEVKKKEQILVDGKLAKIIEDLVKKYPIKYIESILNDLSDDKSFNSVLKDLDIETDDTDADGFDDDELLDDDQDIAFETKVVKPSFDD